jgi:outer membrane translocation and assembly module TamA
MEQWIAQRPWVLIVGVVALGYVLGSSGSPRMRPERTTGMLPFIGGDPYPRMRTNDFAQRYTEPQRFSGGKARAYAS